MDLIARNIVTFFKEKKNKKGIRELKKLGVKMFSQKIGGELDGKRFVFTGALEEYTRSEAKEYVEKNVEKHQKVSVKELIM